MGGGGGVGVLVGVVGGEGVSEFEVGGGGEWDGRGGVWAVVGRVKGHVVTGSREER